MTLTTSVDTRIVLHPIDVSGVLGHYEEIDNPLLLSVVSVNIYSVIGQ